MLFQFLSHSIRVNLAYNSNYISIFQNAGNSLPFPYKFCATTENILTCIIWYFQ